MSSSNKTESELIQFGLEFFQSLLQSVESYKGSTATTTSNSTLDANTTVTKGNDNSNLINQYNHSLNIGSSCHSLLQHTREYRDLIQVLERLQLLQQQQPQQQESVSFLQYDATDEILLRIFSYLQCRTLHHTMLTCTRWYHLTQRYATYRTHTVPKVPPPHNTMPKLPLSSSSMSSRMIRYRRQLSSPLELLQAYENIIGIPPEVSHRDGISQTYNISKVPIPILLPSQYQIQVSDCGDIEYNGIYYCTGCNGNGYIFTKPRNYYHHRDRRRPRPYHDLDQCTVVTESFLDLADSDQFEMIGQPLRCIIARRFSNEDLLWYMSKEVLVGMNETNVNTENDENAGAVMNDHDHPMTLSTTTTEATETLRNMDTTVQQVYSFWAPLMQYNNNDDDENHSSSLLLHYPTFSTAPVPGGRPTTVWQSLATTNQTLLDHPPVVELV